MESSTTKLLAQAASFAVVGGIGGYGLGRIGVPIQATADMVQVLGNVSIVSGSLVGWSIGWLTQSRGIIRDIDYDAAGDAFRDLGTVQVEMIQRWWIVFVSSFSAIVCAVIMKIPGIGASWYCILLPLSSALLVTAVIFIFNFFYRMQDLSKLKSELEEYERTELKKHRLLDKSIV